MKNYNIPSSIVYASVGAILGITLSLSAVMLIEYVGGILRKPLMQEFSLVLLVFATPILFFIGLVLGVLYARKFKDN